MDLKLISSIPNWKVEDQLAKIDEEVTEFKEAIDTGMTKDIIAEGLDVCQTILTMFQVLEIENYITEGVEIHNKKLERRGWELIEIEDDLLNLIKDLMINELVDINKKLKCIHEREFNEKIKLLSIDKLYRLYVPMVNLYCLRQGNRDIDEVKMEEFLKETSIDIDAD
ncbi:hypothetical protein HMPREF3081_06935 [Clostridium sp. HMSC19D02]|uniref:hypothetical protein n=1 Tax=Clostridioides difficile TaxID=1496 RepID=UPI0008A5924A|nr:hypothetical protein [Clostridioides difficile]OFU10960.1 hypothetical protein HMPREF3081_06935 [Clostridium sp. HMSC19D02]EGT3637715.1 hypothetical protein [Clostridioides difficile]EGT4047056.1 hypothetical protein [Clostridioides difficile]EGT4222280.1 hypothetical protein [Clostridioides difficile]EGT5016668.1 hypothetical protein [Clostridioides difficile]